MNDARHIGVTFEQEISGKPLRLHNFYIPAGGDIPDPVANPKFAHKLRFLDELTAWIENDRIADDYSIMVGDLNIAPLEADVWDHKALLKVVSHTPIEVEKLNRVFSAGPWRDAMRMKFDPQEKLYTWWSYRSPNWELANKGRRLDHIWLSHHLAPHLSGLSVHKDARGWERPSDHVPAMVQIDLKR